MMESKSHNRHRLNDKGYSLVELIIVIGIIVVMTGVSMVTVRLINSAKAKEASVTFTSQLADMQTKAKNQMVVISNTKYPTYNYCLMLYKSDGKCYIKTGYYNPDGTTDDTKYIFIDSENNNNGKGVSLSSRIDVKYTGDDGVTKSISSGAVYIVFDRNGRCLLGNGTYSFYKNNGNLVAEVSLKKNGSYQSN